MPCVDKKFPNGKKPGDPKVSCQWGKESEGCSAHNSTTQENPPSETPREVPPWYLGHQVPKKERP
ncbi:hypothetical protein JZ751_000438 [Albula glossodonta]|uniref:Uncharacterized protein n=1 Tax=Albula glossodonta TaxID=121402 RepID=A0A8T2PW62_9TELE|nr:hypothetical protein JZ751_000438 [Albula glossodonta]